MLYCIQIFIYIIYITFSFFFLQVLCHANVAWQTAQGNHIPPNAIVIGATVNGEKLYMGRTLHDGTITPGKVIFYLQTLSN